MYEKKYKTMFYRVAAILLRDTVLVARNSNVIQTIVSVGKL